MQDIQLSNSASILSWLSIASPIISLASGAAVAWLSAWLSTRRFYREKDWERKAKAYEEIVRALHHMTNYFSVHKTDYGQGTGLSDEGEAALYQSYAKSHAELENATDIGSFYISRAAHKKLLELRSRQVWTEDQAPRFEIFEQEYEFHRAALNDLISIARKELRATK